MDGGYPDSSFMNPSSRRPYLVTHTNALGVHRVGVREQVIVRKELCNCIYTEHHFIATETFKYSLTWRKADSQQTAL